MCGIFGYVGEPVQVGTVVLDALQSMEYRGYDSWGVAWTLAEDGDRGHIIKGVGRVDRSAAADGDATAAIGHTRWATHGEVCERNAHPHLGAGGRIALVHNGIIENADALRRRLAPTCPVVSDTDSELMAHLVGHQLGTCRSLTEAVATAFHSIEGNNAFVVLDRCTGEVVVVTRRLPLRLSQGRDALVLASDPAALAGVADTTIAVPDDTAVSLGTPGQPSEVVYQLFAERPAIPVPVRRVGGTGEPGAAMRAEIDEQPEVLRRLAADPQAVSEAADLCRAATRLVFTGCGSASHAAMVAAELVVGDDTRADAIALPASEIEARPALLRPGDVVVALSQSGETADVIDAVSVARARGAQSIGLINAEGSSVERLVDATVPLRAGHEQSVLATKSYLAMLGRVWQLVRAMSCPHESDHRDGLEMEAAALERGRHDPVLQAWVTSLAGVLACRSSTLVVSGGARFPVALEAALKVKEGSYVHAEAVRTGELKHGVIALVDAGFPCLLLAGDGPETGRLGIAAEELRSRGAAIHWCGPCAPASLGSPQVAATPSPFVQTQLAQLVALETAVRRGVDPDYPRNLAKSVTVR